MIMRFHSTIFFIKDLNQTAEFYRRLGFKIQVSDEVLNIKFGKFVWAFMPKAVPEADVKKGRGILNFIEVADAAALYELVLKNGFKIVSDLKESAHSDEFIIEDPDGYQIAFFTSSKR